MGTTHYARFLRRLGVRSERSFAREIKGDCRAETLYFHDYGELYRLPKSENTLVDLALAAKRLRSPVVG